MLMNRANGMQRFAERFDTGQSRLKFSSYRASVKLFKQTSIRTWDGC